jgi:tripartite-type tricarboxylate transporter receptor subunit TctC
MSTRSRIRRKFEREADVKRLLTIGFLIAASSSAFGQSFPDRPVRIIVPSSPGGISDVAARFVGQGLSQIWKQPVVVENRPGGGGSIGTSAVSHAPADGYTLLASTNGEFALGPVINKSISYDPVHDFTPIGLLTFNPIILVANAQAPFKSVQDVLEAAKKKPGEISWASPGVGTWNHLAGEWFQSQAGIKLLHVPYKGGGPAGTAIAAGDTPLAVISISSGQSLIDSGKIRVIAVMSKDRVSFDPDWPTLEERGVAGVNATNWVALFGPAGLDKAITQKIVGDTKAVLNDPALKQKLAKIGVVTANPSPEELAKQIIEDRRLSERIAKEANMVIQ